MPSEYHALHTPHPCRIQDPSAFARVFILLTVWVTLISCSGGSGGSSESATGSNIPTTDGSATGGQHNPVCVAGTSGGEVARPQFLMNLPGQTSWYASPVVADLDGDGLIEIVATTTQTQSSAAGVAQVFVFSSNGALFQPSGLSFPAWPRYNNRTGTGGDADRKGQGHSGYGCYGLNVAIGNIDDDDDADAREIWRFNFIRTNHNHTGLSI